jgi:transcriptional regulator with PAS, ATPase and Fis domain
VEQNTVPITQQLLRQEVRAWFEQAVSSDSSGRAWEARRLDDHSLSGLILADNQQSPVGVRGVTLAAMRLLQAYQWPGNVRELRNEIGRLVHSCPHGQVIGSGMISRHIREETGDASGGKTATADLQLKPALAELETRLIRDALARTDGNRTHAAELLGISRNNLIHKIKSLGIDPV